MTANGHATPKTESNLTAEVPLPGARAALVLLLVINLFNYIDRYVLAAVVPKIRETFFDPVQRSAEAAEQSIAVRFVTWLGDTFGLTGENALIGSLAMAFIVAYMIAAPVFGWLADRMSRWLLVGVGVILWSLASGASGLAATFGMLFFTRCFVGIGEAAYGPVAPTMISDLYPVKIRGSVLAWFYMAIPVGSALGYVYGGQVADSALGWPWAFYLVVPPGLLLGLWCFFMREPPRGQADLPRVLSAGESDPTQPKTSGQRNFPERTPARSARIKDYATLLKTPSYLLDTLGMAAMTFSVGGIAFWMPDYIFEKTKGDMSLGLVNTIFGAITVVAGLAATLLGGIAGDRLRSRYSGSYFLVSGVAMLVAFPLVLLVTISPFPFAWVAVFLAIFCLFFNTGPTNTILANVTHPSIRATGFALNILIIHALGDAVSPLVLGAIADVSNMDFAFQIVSMIILLGGVLWLWGARYLGRDTALAPTRLTN
jgi:MFS family permease